jgi:hypothetical protein
MSEKTVLTHQPCPYEDCGSEDGFSWVPETQIGLCFSCCNTYPNKKKMAVDWAREVYPIREKL